MLSVMFSCELSGCGLLKSHLLFWFDVMTDWTHKSQIVKEWSSTSAVNLSDSLSWMIKEKSIDNERRWMWLMSRPVLIQYRDMMKSCSKVFMKRGYFKKPVNWWWGSTGRIVRRAKGSLNRCERGSYTLGKTASNPPRFGGRRTVKLAFSCNQLFCYGWPE